MRATHLLASALLAIGLASAPTGVRANLIVNGGFEVPVLNNGQPLNFYAPSSLGGWDVIGNVLLLQTNVAEVPNGITRFNAYEGLNALDLTGNGNAGTNVGITQKVSTVAGGLLHDLVPRRPRHAECDPHESLQLLYEPGDRRPEHRRRGADRFHQLGHHQHGRHQRQLEGIQPYVPGDLRDDDDHLLQQHADRELHLQ